MDIWLFGVNFKIPPVDIVLWSEPLTIWDSFLIFDSDWVVSPITTALNAIPQAVWDLCKSTLDKWAQEYYEKHSEEAK